MRHLITSSFIFIMTFAVSGFSQQTTTNTPPVKTASKENVLFVDLQDGYDGSHEVVICVDGHEVYRGKPKTNPVKGPAGKCYARASSSHPVVSLEVLASHIKWSRELDLAKGGNIGLSVITNDVIILQKNGGYGYY